MMIRLTDSEQKLLEQKNIPYFSGHEITEAEALDLLERVREVEVLFSQSNKTASKKLFYDYQKLADKIHQLIPEG